MVPMEYVGARGKMIYEKNQRSKIWKYADVYMFVPHFIYI